MVSPLRRTDGPARVLVAALFGASVIACVAAPFAVVGQRHAPKPPLPAPITHTSSASIAVVSSATETDSVTATPPTVPIVHSFRVADLATDPSVSIVNGTVGKHAFLAALASSGLGPKESHRVLVGFSGVRNLDRAAETDAFTYAKAKDGHVLAFELVPAGAMEGDAFEFFQEREGDAKPDAKPNDHAAAWPPLVAKRVSLPVERRHVKVGVVVGGALKTSLAGVMNEQAATLLDDALDGHAELSDLRAGARLRIVATEERIEGTFASYAPIDAVEYTPAPLADGSVKPAIRVYWYETLSGRSRHGGHYDAQGRQPYHGAWRSPVPMARISSRFNPNRMHPVLHVVMPHNGVDFAASAGTPVYAAAAGVIRSAGDGGPCGNMVQITHPNGLISAYCHLSRFGPISAGEHVETRQLIGYVGQTGRATGPHLHFAVKRANAAGNEIFVDPLSMKLDGVRVVPPQKRADFDEKRKALDAQIDSITLPVSGDARAQVATESKDEPEETE